MAPALLENLWRVAGRRKRSSGELGDPRHIPPTLRGLDPCFIDEWAEGWFTVDGLTVALDGRSPLDVGDAPAGWHEALHGFGWLVDVPMAPEDELSIEFRAATRALVTDWLGRGGAGGAVAQRTDVAARRLISFLAHSDLILENASARLFDQYVRQIGRDARDVLAHWHTLDDEGRLIALIALAQAGLACEDGAAVHMRAETALMTELGRQIAADGGHISRDPRTVPMLLADLIPLKQLYGAAGRQPPRALTNAVAAMTAFASAMRLGDGQVMRLAAVRSEHDIILPPLTLLGLAPETWDAPQTGFARIAASSTALLFDAGSDRATDGALSFEFSAGGVPVVTSAGPSGAREARRGKLRASASARSASHSTLVVDGGGNAGAPSTPSLSLRQRLDVDASAGELTIDATHAGHAAHGFAHRRVVKLNKGGRRIAGQDTLRPLAGPAGEKAAALAFHFQLHPDVAVTMAGNAAVTLSLRDGSIWRFAAPECRISIEDIVATHHGRALPSLELVVRATWPECRGLTWTFETA